jgi:hypothetical protein
MFIWWRGTPDFGFEYVHRDRFAKGKCQFPHHMSENFVDEELLLGSEDFFQLSFPLPRRTCLANTDVSISSSVNDL